MREWFKARNTWGGAFLALSDAEAGRLSKALWTYTMTGAKPNLSGAEKATFAMFQITLDQDAERESDISAKRAVAGSAGGKQKVANQANATFARQNEAKQANANNKNQNQKQNQRQINTDDDDDLYAPAGEDENGQMRNAVNKAFIAEAGRQATPAEQEGIAISASLLGFTEEMVEEAIRIAAANGAKSLVAYTKRILADWAENEVTTPEEAEEHKFLYDAWTGRNDCGSGYREDIDRMEAARKRRKEKHTEETA